MLSSSHHFYTVSSYHHSLPHTSSPSPSTQHLCSSPSSSAARPSHPLPQHQQFHPHPHPYQTVSEPSSPTKRVKLQHKYELNNDYGVPSAFDCPPLLYHTPSAMPALSRHRPLAPHINLQRASEPASPVTISTLSSHSTPSPSPSRVTILSDNSPHDLQLYEDAFQLHEQPSKQHIPRTASALYKQPMSNAHFNGGYVDTDASWAHWNQDPRMQHPQLYRKGYVHGHGQEQIALARAQSQAMLQRQPQTDDDTLPHSPSRSTVTASSRPSISEIDSPSAPVQCSVKSESDCYSMQSMPKLVRTVSDAVEDELFNPGIAPGTSRVAGDHSSESHPSQFPQLFQQAQSRHAMSRATPANIPVLRDSSPFRANSPFHPARTQAEMAQTSPRATSFLPVGGYPTARAIREREMEQEAEALRAQMQKEYEAMQQDPKTISPKDAYIEYHEAEPGVQGSLFANNQHHDEVASQHSDALSSNGSFHESIHDDCDIKMTPSRRHSDVAMEYNAPICYVENGQQDYLNQLGGSYGWAGEQLSQGTSTDAVSRDSDDYGYDSSKSPSLQRPEDTFANSGAYSCTVHGCPLRFPTASKMSKHRREAHRHGTPLDRSATVRSQHQGPHKCVRINPTTGKPCNTIFSRPYDLTRHEDTIHNTARQKVRCEICTEEKTFSRYDALTRHKKVKHGIDK